MKDLFRFNRVRWSCLTDRVHIAAVVVLKVVLQRFWESLGLSSPVKRRLARKCGYVLRKVRLLLGVVGTLLYTSACSS